MAIFCSFWKLHAEFFSDMNISTASGLAREPNASFFRNSLTDISNITHSSSTVCLQLHGFMDVLICYMFLIYTYFFLKPDPNMSSSGYSITDAAYIYMTVF